jgi:predicted O-methyltransferase YrrM
VIARLRRIAKAVLHPTIAPLAILGFRSRARNADLAEAMRIAYAFDFCRIRISPIQLRSEALAFLGAMASRVPKVILEIGTADGGNLFLLTRIAAPDALLISIDLPGGRFGGGYPPWKASLYRAFARSRQRIVLLRADSHASSTIARVAALLRERPLDLLFIDGDHSYDGVKADFDSYAPFVRPGGVIAFHDIVPGQPSDVGGVPRFWQELKSRWQTAEIVEDWGQGGYGIGYATLPGVGASHAPGDPGQSPKPRNHEA